MGVFRINGYNSVRRINSKKPASGSVSWWLAGGIDPANAIAAYQPIGAASYAASKVNLANPGTYDATEGNAPGWDVANGWKFDGIDDYLVTGYHQNNYFSHSMIVKYSNHSETYHEWKIIVGEINYSSRGFAIQVGRYYYYLSFYNGGRLEYFPDISTEPIDHAVLAVTDRGYYNGNPVTSEITEFPYNEEDIMIAGYYNSGTGEWHFTPVFIQAFSIYNTTITPDQVAAVTTAMNAL